MDKDSTTKPENKKKNDDLPEHGLKWPEKPTGTSGDFDNWPKAHPAIGLDPGVRSTKAIYVSNEPTYGPTGVLRARFMSYANDINPLFCHRLFIRTEFKSALNNYFKDLKPIHQFSNGQEESAIYYIDEVYVLVDRPLTLYRSSSSAFDMSISLAGQSEKSVLALVKTIEQSFPVFEEPETDDNKITIDFWSYNKQEPEYPSSVKRDLYAENFEEISTNYNKKVLNSTEKLFGKGFRP